MLYLEVLIWESATVNALTSCAVEVSEISTLHHKATDHSMENASLIGKCFAIGSTLLALSSTKLSEIFGGSGSYVLIELHNNFTSWFASDFNVEIYSWVGW